LLMEREGDMRGWFIRRMLAFDFAAVKSAMVGSCRARPLREWRCLPSTVFRSIVLSSGPVMQMAATTAREDRT